jgi:hypothetical protein
MANTLAPSPTTPPPSTPARAKPPFTPRMKNHGVVRPTTLNSDLSSDNDNDMAFSFTFLPKGHQLVVHGIVPVSNETPAAAVKDLLLDLQSEPHYSSFADFGLNVLPFSDCASNISSAFYVEIPSSGEVEPHVDLLEMVMEAIVEAKPEWEVR